MKPAKLCRCMGQLTGRYLPCLSLVLVRLLHSSFPCKLLDMTLHFFTWTRHLLTLSHYLCLTLEPFWNHKAAWGTQIILRLDTQTSITCHSINKQKTRHLLSVRSFSTSLLVLFCALIGRHVYCLPLAAGLWVSSLECCGTFSCAGCCLSEEDKTLKQERENYVS